MTSRKRALLRETSPQDAAALGVAEEQLDAPQGMHMILFDEDGADDRGLVDMGAVHSTIAEALGESGEDPGREAPVTLPAAEIVSPPMSQAESEEKVREWMATQPDPVPRISDDRLMQRIRIAERWIGHCPKQPNSRAAHNWGLYIDGMTVSAYLAHPEVDGGRKRARRDLAWDVDHGFITLQNPNEWEIEEAARLAAEEGDS